MKLTLSETARCLYIPVDTLERWIRQGRIPIHKSAGSCLFKAEDLKKWAESRNLSFDLARKPICVVPDLASDNLLMAMQRGGVYHDIAGRQLEEVLASAVGCLSFLKTDEQRTLQKMLLEREALASTGIGKGVAIPHPRSPYTEVISASTIVTCFLQNPVDFGSVDDKPVFVLFILLNTSVKNHLHLLSRLSFCVREAEFVDFLKTLPGQEALYTKIAEFEEKLEKSEENRISSV